MLVALSPAGVLTVTATVPVPAGTVAVIKESPAMLKLDADTEPNFTFVAPVKPEPLTETE